jgi:hypothetical protein
MIKSLLILRFKQIYRGIIGIGLIRIFFLILFSGIVLFTKFSIEPFARFISVGFLVILTIFHVKRGDRQFLRTHIDHDKLFMLVEYVLISIPILLLIVFQQQWSSLLLFISLAGIVQLNLNLKQASLTTAVQRMIPSDAIEWKAGVRKQFFLLIPVWILAAVTSFHIASVPIAILVLGLTASSFFEQVEPVQLLMAYEVNPRDFIHKKIKRHLQLFTLSVLPLISLFLIFHFDKWYIPFGELVIFCFLHIYLITIKYAFFEPNKTPPASSVFVGIGIIAGIIPIFLPLVWLLSYRFYRKSITHLAYYLDDYN